MGAWIFWVRGSKLGAKIDQKSIKKWSHDGMASWHRFFMDFGGFWRPSWCHDRVENRSKFDPRRHRNAQHVVGMVFRGFQNDSRGFWRIPGGPRGRWGHDGCRDSGPLMTVWSMEGGVCVGKWVERRAAPKGEGLVTPSAPRRGGGLKNNKMKKLNK